MITILKNKLTVNLIRHAQVNWTFADQAVVSAANFLTSLIVARLLGVESFGTFSIVWLVLLFVQSLQIALILTPMLSIGPKTLADAAVDYYASVQPLQIGFAIVSGLISAGALCLAGPMLGIGESGPGLAFPLALAVVATQMHEFFRRYCFARSLSSKALHIDLVRYGFQFAAMLYIFNRGQGSVQNTLLAISASAVLGLVVLARDFPALSWQRSHIFKTLVRHWNMSKWLVSSALLQWTSGNFFALAAGAMLGPAAVGAMRAAQNLMGVTHVFFQALDNWAPVRTARIHTENGLLAMRRFTRRMLLFTGVATILAVLVLALPARLWLSLLYGPDYGQYGWLVMLYGLSYFFMALHAPYRYTFVAIEDTRPVFFGYMIAAMFSVIGVYPLLTMFSMHGAMTGIVMTQFILLVSFFVSERKLSVGA